jgi:hypothetical protein
MIPKTQDSLLLRKVTCKPNYWSKQLYLVSLVTAVKGEQRQIDLVKANRKLADETKQKKHKIKNFPVFVAAGIIKLVPAPTADDPEATEKEMVEYSGFAQLDFDGLRSLGLDPEVVRDEFAKLWFVSYSGLSVRGGGVWLLVYLDAYDLETYTKRWKACFEFCYSLLDKFLGYKLKRDSKGTNPTDYRFICPDPDAKWNFNPEPFTVTLKESKPIPAPKPAYNDSSRLVQLLDLIVEKRIDLTSSYEDWRNLSFSLTATMGESGREWFHALSQFYDKYSPTETDKQFDASIKRNGYGFSEDFIFALARNHGIILKEYTQPTINQITAFEAEKPDKGYPDSWDDTTPLPGYERRKQDFENQFLTKSAGLLLEASA